MEYYLVSPLKIVHRADHLLTYQSDKKLTPGVIVSVEVGKKSVPAVVIEKVVKPSFDTKVIEKVITALPLPGSLLKLHSWLASYYVSHPVTVWQTMLPSGLLKNRRPRTTQSVKVTRKRTSIVLNEDQKQAISHILSKQSGTTLLHGITGSGKTVVYLEIAKQTIAEGRSVILLVPEIALTSQLIAEFTPAFPNLIVTHSTMTEADRHKTWQTALESDKPILVIGPRSALFTPVPKLGLIIVDECHEPSFKQEKSPRYSALRAASTLGKYAGARVIFGSATPNVSDYYLASSVDPESIIELPSLAQKKAVIPTSELVDMTKRANFPRSPFLSNKLIIGIDETLQAGNQALIFHNRRGSAPMTLCTNCGWNALCPRCFIPLTLHADQFELRCHICNHLEHVPTTCPVCNHADIIHKGIGTKRIVEALSSLFPKARISRFDGDNDTKDGVETHYQALYDGDIDIIVGTQVIAKGLDLPKLRFVGVVQADSGLSLPDYQSSERVFQLLTQVSGRVGRNEHHSQVVVQSYQPTHPSVQFGLKRDYHGFYEFALKERKRANFPPYTYLLKLTCSYGSESAAVHASRQLANDLRQKISRDIQILGPAPAFYERTRDSFRWQLVLKSPRRQHLVDALQSLPPTHWQSELDPASLL